MAMTRVLIPMITILMGCSVRTGENDLAASYAAVQEALAADAYGGARTALESFRRSAPEDLRTLVDEVLATGDIDSMRRAFKGLSEEMSGRELPPGYVVAFCPMADGFQGAHWVQREGPVRNPYFGSSMLECGEVVEPGH